MLKINVLTFSLFTGSIAVRFKAVHDCDDEDDDDADDADDDNDEDVKDAEAKEN